jgi:hypothetical protein
MLVIFYSISAFIMHQTKVMDQRLATPAQTFRDFFQALQQ